MLNEISPWRNLKGPEQKRKEWPLKVSVSLEGEGKGYRMRGSGCWLGLLTTLRNKPILNHESWTVIKLASFKGYLWPRVPSECRELARVVVFRITRVSCTLEIVSARHKNPSTEAAYNRRPSPWSHHGSRTLLHHGCCQVCEVQGRSGAMWSLQNTSNWTNKKGRAVVWIKWLRIVQANSASHL